MSCTMGRRPASGPPDMLRPSRTRSMRCERHGKACRVAIDFYRARTGAYVVPEIVRVVLVDGGKTFDARTCSRLTEELRATPAQTAPEAPAVTPGRIARLEAELERRRAGLARVLAGDAAFSSADAEAWDADDILEELEPVRVMAPRPRWRPLPELMAGASSFALVNLH